MAEALIVANARTAIGRAGKGSLAGERPDDLLAFVLSAVLDKVPELAGHPFEDVVVGCARPEQKQGDNLARRAALLAGIAAPGTTVARYCASGLQATRMAAHAVRAGEGDLFLVGGVESISQVDRTSRQEDDRHPRLQGRSVGEPDVYIAMGLTAENVADRYDVSRADMDRFAQRSQELAVAAQRAGIHAREIVPYTTRDGVVVETDDGPRATSTLEGLAALRPAFREGGRVTAGNACPLNDGAAALIVVSDRLAEKLGLEPLARIVSSGVSAVEPEYMGVGPIAAIRQALERAAISIDDLDVFELNEAFAAQVIPVCEAVGIEPLDDRVNPHGGAIALGHPFGMTGARMIGAVVNGLDVRDGRFGLASMCVAGGQGMAMVVERLS